MNLLLDALSWLLILGGGFLTVVGAVGLLRFPDFFTRVHAASLTDTGGLGLMVLGLLLQTGLTHVGLKLVMVMLFLLYTGPVATHALCKAALQRGLVPWSRAEEDKPSKL
jgi:multicomponent Na+:H+ antiporter subunit G